MTYLYYKTVKGGKAPKTAPTFDGETVTKPKTPAAAARYVCSVCGYIYDPLQGDPKNGVAPGTSFEDIPSSWTCPVCGVDKSNFTIEQ